MSAVIDQVETISPRQGETYTQYVQRAHYALMAELPDWQDRNQRVWAEWESHNGEPLRNRARQYFSDQYRFVPNVCYFSEHETFGRDGKPVRYSFNELADIVSEQNSRADKHNYAAVVSRHTADQLLPEDMEPKVLGYVGAARLGMVGNEQPQWAIFVDEHHKTDAYSKKTLDDKQRRSVEVNRYRDGRRSYFDPVAALGADSPRLPLPVARYTEEEAIVERYSIVAPAQVSGDNTFIPSFGAGRKKPQDQQYSEQDSMGLTEQDIASIVQAIRGTPEMQWVQSQMGGGGQPKPDAGAPGAPSGQPAPSAPPSQPPSPPHAGGQHPPGGQQYMSHAPQLPRYSASEDEELELTDKYSKLHDMYADLNLRYSKLNEVNADLMKQHSLTRQAVMELEKRESDKDREMQLKDLYQKYPHFVEVKEELDRCLYSRGSEMTADQFALHLQSVERYAQRSSPVTQMVPGRDPLKQPETEQYAAKISDLIVDRYHQYEKSGEYKNYEVLEAEVRADIAAGKIQV